MTDVVFIRELTAFATIGVYTWEKSIKQKLVFNLEMGWDFAKAAQSDDVQFCLNYAEISQKILDFVANHQFQLVETLAYRLADLLQSEYQLPWLRLELHKPTAVPQAMSVGVVVERGEK